MTAERKPWDHPDSLAYYQSYRRADAGANRKRELASVRAQAEAAAFWYRRARTMAETFLADGAAGSAWCWLGDSIGWGQIALRKWARYRALRAMPMAFWWETLPPWPTPE